VDQPKLQNMKNEARIHTEQTADSIQNRTHMFKVLNVTNNICGSNCDSSPFQVSL